MKVLILSEHEVKKLLPMERCIGVMTDALAALARGEVHNPLRQAIRAPGAPGLLGLMPAWRAGETPYYGLKEVCVFPDNPKRGLDTHLGAVILHSGETGEPLAFMNASAITAIRTAAVSAVATRLLAREDAAVLAIIGTGVQGQSHREAIPLVRPIREIRMCGRGESVEDAVRGADIVVTATSSKRGWQASSASASASSMPGSVSKRTGMRSETDKGGKAGIVLSMGYCAPGSGSGVRGCRRRSVPRSRSTRRARAIPAARSGAASPAARRSG